eukprot:GHVQ01030614.1.p1 GENE.GHVQ01030614.1~~GHVQ01030614.1.p1  ORF type:complete len:494 (-),score=31.35 GHVQ01030614.1:63-1544(-)
MCARKQARLDKDNTYLQVNKRLTDIQRAITKAEVRRDRKRYKRKRARERKAKQDAKQDRRDAEMRARRDRGVFAPGNPWKVGRWAACNEHAFCVLRTWLAAGVQNSQWVSSCTKLPIRRWKTSRCVSKEFAIRMANSGEKCDNFDPDLDMAKACYNKWTSFELEGFLKLLDLSNTNRSDLTGYDHIKPVKSYSDNERFEDFLPGGMDKYYVEPANPKKPLPFEPRKMRRNNYAVCSATEFCKYVKFLNPHDRHYLDDCPNSSFRNWHRNRCITKEFAQELADEGGCTDFDVDYDMRNECGTLWYEFEFGDLLINITALLMGPPPILALSKKLAPRITEGVINHAGPRGKRDLTNKELDLPTKSNAIEGLSSNLTVARLRRQIGGGQSMIDDGTEASAASSTQTNQLLLPLYIGLYFLRKIFKTTPAWGDSIKYPAGDDAESPKDHPVDHDFDTQWLASFEDGSDQMGSAPALLNCSTGGLTKLAVECGKYNKP